MVAFLLGLPIPDIDLKEHPIDDQFYDTFIFSGYWRIMFALPIAFSIVQNLLLLTVFNYDTPKFLK